MATAGTPAPTELSQPSQQCLASRILQLQSQQSTLSVFLSTIRALCGTPERQRFWEDVNRIMPYAGLNVGYDPIGSSLDTAD